MAVLTKLQFFAHGSYSDYNNIIFCTWTDTRRRDAYYKVLSRIGYDWGRIGKEKCIMKTYRLEDINPEVLEDE